MKDVYVVVAENNQPMTIAGKTHQDDGGPLVFEQYTRVASLENMKKRAKQISKNYGKCRIAKLQFIPEEDL